MAFVTSQLLAALILTALLLWFPIGGARFMRELKRRLAFDPGARVWAYRRTMLELWALAAAVVAYAALQPHPLDVLPLVGTGRYANPAVLMGLALGLALGGVAMVLLARFTRRGVPMAGDTAAILPTNARERWLWVAVSLTAGICEELAYRGFLLHVLRADLPQASTLAQVILAAAIFGAAHAYQGWKGVLGTAALGGFLCRLAASGTGLGVLMLVHALIDLRAMLATVGREVPAVPRPA